MTPATRRFYTRYHMLASIVPAYLQGLLLAGLLFVQYGLASGISREAGWVIAGLWALCCLAGFELLSRTGFVLAGTPARRITPDTDDEIQLKEALRADEEAVKLKPALVDIGDVPLLAAGGYTPDQLWISTFTLHKSSIADLRMLIAHERAHVSSSDLSRFILAVAFWGLSWPAAQIAQGNLLWLLAVAFIQGALWLHIRQMFNARFERAADLTAAKEVGKDEYAHALTRYLAQFEPSGATGLRRSRLRGLGLDHEEIKQLIERTS